MINKSKVDFNPLKSLVIPCLNKYTEVDDETFKKLSEESKRKDGKVGSSDGTN